MASLLSLKRRIQAAQNVSKTTRALQMIAASKMKRAQEAALSTRPYVEKVKELTSNAIGKAGDTFSHPYLTNPSDSGKTLLIVLSPDKGLCGGLVTNLLKEYLSFTKIETNTEAIVVGRKLEGNISKSGQEVIANFLFGLSTPSFDLVYPIISLIDDHYTSGKVSQVKVLYTHFTSVFQQTPKVITLLPFSPLHQGDEGQANITVKNEAEYVYEPGVKEILPSLLKHTLEMSLYQYMLESFVSEQGSRMVAMQNATDNARDIIAEYKLEYNKTRQAKITSEILDIGSGAAMANN